MYGLSARDLVARDVPAFAMADVSVTHNGDRVEISVGGSILYLDSPISETELAGHLASVVQDFIADDRGVAWPEIAEPDGGNRHVLDVEMSRHRAQWSTPGFTAPVGSLREHVARAGLELVEPWETESPPGADS